MEREARAAAETAARASYGRLVAYLAARSRDVAAAEDALAEAFRVALDTWPARGIPDRPEAWLLTVARRHLGGAARHRRVRADAALTVRLIAEELHEVDDAVFPDERLKLLFICAHPAIDAGVRTPLMLQTILGLDAARIASAFLTAPATMGQRLVRAKAKIRDAGIAFVVPETHELPARLDAVLEAIYAAYGSGWDDVAGADPRRKGLAGEAVWLARLVAQLLPTEPEARGLLGLLLHCEARRPARRDTDGSFVPLTEQDTTLWSQPLLTEAERELQAAAACQRLGHFQLEAAIQSAHASRARTGRTPWEGIASLYAGLAAMAPTMGVLVGRAAAVAEAQGSERGLALLAQIPMPQVTSYQPYWALSAHLNAQLGRVDPARDAYARAIGLAEDAAVRQFLLERSARLAGSRPN